MPTAFHRTTRKHTKPRMHFIVSFIVVSFSVSSVETLDTLAQATSRGECRLHRLHMQHSRIVIKNEWTAFVTLAATHLASSPPASLSQVKLMFTNRNVMKFNTPSTVMNVKSEATLFHQSLLTFQGLYIYINRRCSTFLLVYNCCLKLGQGHDLAMWCQRDAPPQLADCSFWGRKKTQSSQL